MSKTPRTDAIDEVAFDVDYFDYSKMRSHARELETELADMREMFREYVKAEDKWRYEKSMMNSDDLRIEAAKLRKQAKEVLGL